MGHLQASAKALWFAIAALQILCCLGVTYTKPHNLIVDGQTSGSLYINQPTGYVIVRNSRLTSTFRIDGNVSSYDTDPPMELTILVEDSTFLETVQFRYWNLHGNSSITVQNIVGEGTKADTNVLYLILDNTPVLFRNMTQHYVFYRYATMFNGSTLTFEDITLPREGTTTYAGQLRLQVINAKEQSNITFNNMTVSTVTFTSSALYDSSVFWENSVVHSDAVCPIANCHFNVSTTVMNHGTFAIRNSQFPNASLRITSLTAQNKTLFLVENSLVESDEFSGARTRFGILLSSGSVFETGTEVRLSRVTIRVHNLHPDVKLVGARALYTTSTFRAARFSITACTIDAMRDTVTIGNAIYITAFSDSSFFLDADTVNAIQRGNVLLYGFSNVQEPMNLTNIYNPVTIYLRGAFGQSLTVDNVVLARLELQNFFLDEASSAITVANSKINYFEVDTNAMLQNGASLTVTDTEIPNNVELKSITAMSGSKILFRNISAINFNWPSGALQDSSLIVEQAVLRDTMALSQGIESGSVVSISGCTINEGLSFNGNSITKNSHVSIINNTVINDMTLTTTGTATGIEFRSGSITDSTVIIANNTVRATFVNTNTPTPTDLAYGIFLEATMQVSGASTVAYLYNTITSTQNGAPGVSILHDAVTRTSVPLSYQPPVPATGPSTAFVGRDVVEFRLDGNSTLTIDWCTMWDVASLRLKLYGGGADRPFVLDGADARGVGDLTLDCGGGAGAMPVYVTNSRFASLTLTRCSVTDATPFVLEDVHVNGTLTWGPTGVSNAAAALLFNATVAGGVVEPLAHTGVLPPSNVTRPPVLHLERYADAARWNAEACFGDAPPFSYTPSATASDGTPTPSTTLQPTPSETLPPTPSRTRSRTVVATETATAPLSATLSATSTGVLTESVSGAATLSAERTTTHEVSPTASQKPTTSITRSGTVAPPTRSRSATYTPPATATRTASATVSVVPCDGAPVMNGTAAATTEDALTDAAGVFALHVGTAVMYAAAVHAPSSNHGGGDEAEVVLNASMYRAVWVRESDSLPSDLAGEGVLPASAVELAVVGSTNSSSSSTPSPTASRDALGWLRLRLDLTRLASESGGARFDEVFPTAVRLELEPAFFAARHCGYRVVAGVVLIEASSSMLLDAANGLLQGVGDVAAVGGIVAGGGTAGDAVSLAILADMGCARPVVKESGHNQRLLSPAAFDASVPGMLYGSLLLCAVFPLVHVAVTLGYAHRIGALRTTPLVAMARLRFPSWTFGVLMYLHQGVTYLSLKILFAPPPDDAISGGATAAAVFGLLYALLAPPAFVLVAARYIDATFVEYDFAATAEDSRPSSLWRRILPMGRWEVREVRNAYGVMLSPLRRAHPMWAAFAFASPSLVAVVAVARPTSAAGCAHQYAWMCCVLAGYGVLAYVYRPYRAAVNNGLCAVSTGSLFGIAAMSLVQAGAGGAVNVRATSALTFVCVMLQMVTTGLRLAYIVFLSFNERVRTAGVVMHARFRRSPDDVWLAFPCLGWCSGTFALKRMRAEQKRAREERKFEKENDYVVPPPIVVKQPKAELEKPLLPPAEKPQDPAVLANCHIIDVSQLEDVDTLLQEKAAPDNIGDAGSEGSVEGWNMSTPSLPVLPSRDQLLSRSAQETANDSTEVVEREPEEVVQVGEGAVAVREKDLSVTGESQADSVFHLLSSNGKSGSPEKSVDGSRSRTSMIVDADFGQFGDTRRRSVSCGAVVDASSNRREASPVDIEMKPRSRTVPPEGSPSAESPEALKASWDRLLVSETPSLGAQPAPKPMEPNAVLSGPSFGDSMADSDPLGSSKAVDDTAESEPKKRSSVFDVAPFDPRMARAKTLAPRRPSPLVPGGASEPSQDSVSPPITPEEGSSVSPEWVMADREEAQLLTVPKNLAKSRKNDHMKPPVHRAEPPEPQNKRASIRRRRSMSVDHAWSISTGTPSPSTFAAKAPGDSEPLANPLMRAAQPSPVRAPGLRLPSIYETLPVARREGRAPREPREIVRSKKPGFSDASLENKRLSRVMSFSL